MAASDELGYEVLELPVDRGLRLAVFQATPGSRSAESLSLLASWASAPRPDAAPTVDAH